MKLYTDKNQTAKLIKLGLEKPKGWCVEGISSRFIMYKHKEDNEGFNYSIGELIEMLEEVASVIISYSYQKRGYYVRVIIPKRIGGGMYRISQTELVDALYDMIVKLKEEGVI